MIQLGNTKTKITKDRNGENVPHLKITEAVLVRLSTRSKSPVHSSS